MTNAQVKAIARFRRFMEQNQIGDRAGHAKVISEWEVKETEWLVSITAKTDIPSLGPNNLLRHVEKEFWLVFVGKNGGLTAKMYPDCFKQFKTKQRTAFGINFK
jgi:hypothetical protein